MNANITKRLKVVNWEEFHALECNTKYGRNVPSHYWSAKLFRTGMPLEKWRAGNLHYSLDTYLNATECTIFGHSVEGGFQIVLFPHDEEFREWLIGTEKDTYSEQPFGAGHLGAWRESPKNAIAGQSPARVRFSSSKLRTYVELFGTFVPDTTVRKFTNGTKLNFGELLENSILEKFHKLRVAKRKEAAFEPDFTYYKIDFSIKLDIDSGFPLLVKP